MMDRILSFGGGLQTTALAILVAQRQVEVDAVVFADTGAERPETYWYIDEYVKPLLKDAGVEFLTVRKPDETLYEYCWRKQLIPSVIWRWCTDRWKVRPITKVVGKKAIQLIGFSTNESYRAAGKSQAMREFPLIDRGLSATDCRAIISEFGWPTPLKSACYICSFTSVAEWLWLKITHGHLFDEALELELNWQSKNPATRSEGGLLHGSPLKHIAEGKQVYLPFEAEYSCHSGYCSR